ncbi:hypothetical protein BGX27_008696 [Mortierella sp. AM989]|nr:hypothetical protein BGX27_008696 [Mortierella sp. AM989]
MAQMLDIINIASVVITLPDIMVEVGYEVDQLQWVASAYALAYGAFLLIGGRFGDLFGHRRIYILGVTWFSIWAVVNGFAKNPIVMSVSRALQGMGAGFTVPSALAILTTTYPVGPERTQALAIFGGTGAIGSVIGVLLGGVFGSTIGIVCVIYYLSEGSSAGWAEGSTLAVLCVGIALLIFFIVVEYKIDYPIMPLYIWRSRRLVASCLGIICLSAAVNTMIFFTSLTFQNVQGYTPLKTSLSYIVHGVGAIVAIIALTKLVTIVRTKIITIVGWFFLIGAAILFAQIQADSSYWSIAFPAMILNFLGLAPVWLCCQVNSVADADNENQGVVGAVGAPLGIAISNIIANSRNRNAEGVDLLKGYHAAFYSYAIMSGVGLIITIIFAANQDVGKAEETVTEVAAISAKAGEEDLEAACSGEILEIKGNGGVASDGNTTTSQGSSTSLGVTSEKAQMKY